MKKGEEGETEWKLTPLLGWRNRSYGVRGCIGVLKRLKRYVPFFPPPPVLPLPHYLVSTLTHLLPQFYAEHHDRFYFLRLVSHATSGPFVALALAAPDAIKRWRTLIGPTKVFRGQWEDGSCLRARYGTSDTRNGFHGAFSRPCFLLLFPSCERRPTNAPPSYGQVRTLQSQRRRNWGRSSRTGMCDGFSSSGKRQRSSVCWSSW